MEKPPCLIKLISFQPIKPFECITSLVLRVFREVISSLTKIIETGPYMKSIRSRGEANVWIYPCHPLYLKLLSYYGAKSTIYIWLDDIERDEDINQLST